jgi:hypothetical protein
VNPYTGIWNCIGSHFSGGLPDCVRRHGSSGHDAVEHRLVVEDADLGLAGASYFYEAAYTFAEISPCTTTGARAPAR